NGADTWEWDGSVWILRSPAHAPSPRISMATGYDPLRSLTVLFGGVGGSGYFNDLWEWDGNDWQVRSPASRPSPRGDGGLAFDPNTSKMLLFGGALGPNGAVTDETWLWDGGVWQQRFPATPPYVREGHAMVTDTARRRVVMIGSTLGNDAFAWEWDGAEWSQRLIASPSPRAGPAMVYDSVRHEVVM